MPSLRFLPAVLVLCAMPAVAAADGAETPRDESGTSAAAVGAAIVPGVLVHGSGLWIRGDHATARRLAIVEGIGLAAAAVSGGVLAASGANRRLSPPMIPLLVSGSGTFLLSWLADIYGSASGGRDARYAAAPPLTLELGAAAIHDPLFDYSAFSRAAAELIAGRLRIDSEILVAVDDDNQRVVGDLAYRLVPPRPGDGTRLELAGGLRAHRYGSDGFTTYLASLALEGRLDLARLGPSLSGAFATLSAGWGLEITDYRPEGADTDFSDLLLGRFGFGLYLGDADRPVHGEVSLYYDHRRDELVGGISPGQQASGFLGYVGAELKLDLGRRWGLSSRVELGSAYLASAGVRLRLGGPR